MIFAQSRRFCWNCCKRHSRTWQHSPGSVLLNMWYKSIKTILVKMAAWPSFCLKSSLLFKFYSSYGIIIFDIEAKNKTGCLTNFILDHYNHVILYLCFRVSRDSSGMKKKYACNAPRYPVSLIYKGTLYSMFSFDYGDLQEIKFDRTRRFWIKGNRNKISKSAISPN